WGGPSAILAEKGTPALPMMRGNAGAKCCGLRVEARFQLPLNPRVEAGDAEAAIGVIGEDVHVPHGGRVRIVRGDLEDIRISGDTSEVVLDILVGQDLGVTAEEAVEAWIPFLGGSPGC